MNYYFSDYDTVALAKEYKTPLYVMSEDIILERIKEIRDDFTNKYDKVEAHYASKAFLTKEMARIIKREGLGLDVVSGGELYTARAVDFPMEKITFHGNNKSIEEIQMGLDYGIGHFVCDSLDEIHLVNKLASESEKIANILLRITPGVDADTHKYISTGNVDSKFGIPLNYFEEAVRLSMNYENINLLGFHFHIGSQLFDNSYHILALERLLDLIKDIKERLGFTTKELNVGGGFGIYYKEGDERAKLSYFMDPIMNKINEYTKENNLYRPKVYIEPGRWIVGEAGITLYTIGSIEDIPGIRTYVGIDGGLPDNPRPALYQAEYEALVANKYKEALTEKVTIAGKCCESGDILIEDLSVPKLEEGDILAVKSTGAYNYSMASNYNRLPKPAVVMIREGQPRLIVKRETYDDILKNEI